MKYDHKYFEYIWLPFCDGNGNAAQYASLGMNNMASILLATLSNIESIAFYFDQNFGEGCSQGCNYWSYGELLFLIWTYQHSPWVGEYTESPLHTWLAMVNLIAWACCHPNAARDMNNYILLPQFSQNYYNKVVWNMYSEYHSDATSRHLEQCWLSLQMNTKAVDTCLPL